MAGTSFITATGIKAPKTTKPFNEKNVYSIASAKTLLSSPQRRNIIYTIKNTINAPEEYYYTLYEKLINDFVEFVQILPVNNEARLASLMDEGLLRALYAVEEYKLDVSDEEFDPLMAYLLFSSAVLFDVGCVVENRTVMLCNKKGEFKKKWNPHEGAMHIDDGHYRIRRGGGSTAWSSRRLNVLFASLLMPRDGLAWIYSNVQTYNMWISLLNYDREGAGRFSLYLDHTLEKLEKIKLTNEFVLPLDAELINNSEGLADAENFIEWLTQGLKKGDITLNASNSNAYMVNEGLLLTTDIFNQYNDAVHKDIKIAEMLEQLEKLGFTDGKIQSYSQAHGKGISIRSGLSSMFHDAHTAADSSKMVADVTKGSQESKVAFLGTGAALQGPVIHSLVETIVGPATSTLSSAVKISQSKTAGVVAKGYPQMENVVTPESLTVRTSVH